MKYDRMNDDHEDDEDGEFVKHEGGVWSELQCENVRCGEVKLSLKDSNQEWKITDLKATIGAIEKQSRRGKWRLAKCFLPMQHT